MESARVVTGESNDGEEYNDASKTGPMSVHHSSGKPHLGQLPYALAIGQRPPFSRDNQRPKNTQPMVSPLDLRKPLTPETDLQASKTSPKAGADQAILDDNASAGSILRSVDSNAALDAMYRHGGVISGKGQGAD